jgi:hypothetical protein
VLLLEPVASPVTVSSSLSGERGGRFLLNPNLRSAALRRWRGVAAQMRLGGLAVASTVVVLVLLTSPSPTPLSLVQQPNDVDSLHYWGADLFSRFSGEDARTPVGSHRAERTLASSSAVSAASLRTANPITVMQPPVPEPNTMTPKRLKLLRKLKALLKSKPAGSVKSAAALHVAHRAAMITTSVPDVGSQKLAQVTVHTGGCGGGATVIPCDQMKGIDSDWATLRRVDSMDKNLIASLQPATVVTPTTGAYSSLAPCAGSMCGGTTVKHTHIPSALPSVLSNLQGLIDNMQFRMLLTPWGGGGSGGGSPGAPGPGVMVSMLPYITKRVESITQ